MFRILGPIELNKVYVHGLSDSISRDELELYIEQLIDRDIDVVDVCYGLDPTIALVTFNKNIGI